MRYCYLVCAVLCLTTTAIAAVAEPTAARVPRKIESTVLPNAFQVSDKVISGGQPAGDAAFAELAKLGVKTMISVDGAKPDVAAAKKHGLRYVHLPHGYDGIPADRLLDLAKAIRDLPGTVYIHCHHGKHRSPAASAAACVSIGAIETDDAMRVLAAAGTSQSYRGLYQTVQEATRIDNKTLDERQVEFREVVEIPPMADAMVAIEHTHDHLKQIAAAGWQPTEAHPDIDPPHEALLLREHFAELLRAPETKQQSREFIDILRRSEADAQTLEGELRAGKATPKELTAVFDRITADCAACHQKFRDVPLGEKSQAR